MSKRTFGWHFTGPKLRDGTPLPKVGVWEVYKGKLEMCESGLHVGITPFDALQYAPGATLRLVEYAEVGDTQSDKIVCAKRRTIAQMDATELLRYFARLQAISCIDRWGQEPPDVVLDFLATGDEELRAAAWAAARAAARDAARAAAWAAARDAARAAAWDAAWDAARDAAKQEFNALVYECFEGPMREIGWKP